MTAELERIRNAENVKSNEHPFTHTAAAISLGSRNFYFRCYTDSQPSGVTVYGLDDKDLFPNRD
jgi:hypothetical protein